MGPLPCGASLPVEEQLGRDGQHLPGGSAVDPRRVAAALGALQGGKQGLRRARPAPAQPCGVVDLVVGAARNAVLDVRQRGVKRGALGLGVPVDARIVCGCRCGGPGQRRIVRRKPGQGQRGVARLHGERGVERGRGLVAQPAQHPGAAPCCGLGSVEHSTHLVQRMGRPHGTRRAKRMAQAGTGRIMRVGKVDQ
jgi:hypothetical protein